jgi:type I restriction enzyme R subunit
LLVSLTFHVLDRNQVRELGILLNLDLIVLTLAVEVRYRATVVVLDGTEGSIGGELYRVVNGVVTRSAGSGGDGDNMLVAQGTDTTDLVTIKELKNLLKIVTRRLDWVNYEQSSSDQENLQQMLNQELENVSFSFYKEGEGELVLQQQFKETVRSTRQQLTQCIDPQDPEFISLLEEFKRVLKKKDINEAVEFNMADRVANLNDILKRVRILNEKDRILSLQYHNDLKFARIHQRLEQKEEQEKTTPNPYGWSKNTQKLNAVLLTIKEKTDDCYLHNEDLTANADYFTRKIVTFITN